MNHDEVVRLKLTERYFLDELDPEKREEFEEHYFDCQECALDVRAASMFVEQSKTLLAEDSGKAVGPSAVSGSRGWLHLGWFRPGFAVAALAVLLAVIGYQNMVTYPHLEQAANRPQVVPWASLNIGTRGSNTPIVPAARGGGFLLLLNIPPDSRYSRYIADLYNPAGKLEWSLTIPADMANDVSPVEVPGADREAGIYSLTVNGINVDGQNAQVGQATFELQIQK